MFWDLAARVILIGVAVLLAVWWVAIIFFRKPVSVSQLFLSSRPPETFSRAVTKKKIKIPTDRLIRRN